MGSNALNALLGKAFSERSEDFSAAQRRESIGIFQAVGKVFGLFRQPERAEPCGSALCYTSAIDKTGSGLPQPVEVAVGISGDRLVSLGQGKDRLGLLAGLQVLDLAALLGLQNNPFDEVLGEHGVLYGAHRHGDLAALGLHHGDVLLHGGVGGAGDDLGHLLAAAHDRHAAGLDKGDNVSAMLTDIEFHSDPSSCRWYCVWHLFLGGLV